MSQSRLPEIVLKFPRKNYFIYEPVLEICEMIIEHGDKNFDNYSVLVPLSFPYNHCCNGNATVRSVCIVELHFSVSNIKVFIVVQQCYFGAFVSPETA
jgi:hypothetical protein